MKLIALLQSLGGSMKGDPIKPAPFEIGKCFICLKPCEGYCHQYCAVAMAEEKDKRREKAREIENCIENKKSMLEKA